VRSGDVRAAGHYEPTADWPTLDADYDRVAAAFGTSFRLECTGRIGSERCYDYRALVRSARRLPAGKVGVTMVDLLAAVRLHGTADIVVFTDQLGDQLAVPVRDLMRIGSLVLGTVCESMVTAAGLAMTLEVPGWTDDEAPFEPVSMHAISFAEFVSCS